MSSSIKRMRRMCLVYIALVCLAMAGVEKAQVVAGGGVPRQKAPLSINNSTGPSVRLTVSAAEPVASSKTAIGQTNLTLDVASGNLTLSDNSNDTVVIPLTSFVKRSVFSTADITMQVDPKNAHVFDFLIGTDTVLFLKFLERVDNAGTPETYVASTLTSPGEDGLVRSVQENIRIIPYHASSGLVYFIKGPVN